MQTWQERNAKDSLFPYLSLIFFSQESSSLHTGLKEKAAHLLSSPNPKVKMRFPKRVETAPKSNTKSKRNPSSAKDGESGWITTKKKSHKAATPRSSSKKKNQLKKKNSSSGISRKRGSTGSASKNTDTPSLKSSRRTSDVSSCEVIDILDDDSDDSDIVEEIITSKRPKRAAAARSMPLPTAKKFDDFNDSDSDFEFEWNRQTDETQLVLFETVYDSVRRLQSPGLSSGCGDEQ